jgi:hypothetical protein
MTRASSRQKRDALGGHASPAFGRFDDAAPTMKMSPVTSTAAHALVSAHDGPYDGKERAQSGVWSVQEPDALATLSDVSSSPDVLATWKHDAAAIASAWHDGPPAHAAASTWLDAVPLADASLALRAQPHAPAPRVASAPRAVVSSHSVRALSPNATISPDGTLMPWGDVPVSSSRRGTIVTAFLLTVATLVIAGFGLAWTADSVAVAARVARNPAPGVRHLQLVNSAETKLAPSPISGRLAHRARVPSSRSAQSSDDVGGEGLAD